MIYNPYKTDASAHTATVNEHSTNSGSSNNKEPNEYKKSSSQKKTNTHTKDIYLYIYIYNGKKRVNCVDASAAPLMQLYECRELYTASKYIYTEYRILWQLNLRISDFWEFTVCILDVHSTIGSRYLPAMVFAVFVWLFVCTDVHSVKRTHTHSLSLTMGERKPPNEKKGFHMNISFYNK